jgi:hypothetical protein
MSSLHEMRVERIIARWFLFIRMLSWRLLNGFDWITFSTVDLHWKLLDACNYGSIRPSKAPALHEANHAFITLWDFRFSRWRVWRWLSSRMLHRAVFCKVTNVSQGDDRPDDGDGKHLRNVGQFVPDYTAQRSIRKLSFLQRFSRTTHILNI